MNIKATLSHFVITEMSYITHLSEETLDASIEECISQSTKGRIGIHKELSNFYFEVVTDVETWFEKEENVPYRNIELSVRYIYDLELEEEIENSEELYPIIRNVLDKQLLSHCRQHVREIIRQITSIDYQPSLITDSIDISLEIDLIHNEIDTK